MPTLVEKPPEGGDWIHEIKFDGYRSQIVIDAGTVRVFTRRGHDWTDKYRAIAEEAAELGVERAIIDGEIVLPDEQGKPRFGDLRSAIASRPYDLVFMAFDLLHLSGNDLLDRGLEARRDRLSEILVKHGRLQFSGSLAGSAADIFRLVEDAGLEGMVSKRIGSKYRSGPSNHWLKAKCYSIGHFDIVGVQRETGKPAMVLMAEKSGRYIGGAFVSANMEMRDRLWALVGAKAGGETPIGVKDVKKAEWLKPGLVGRVKFLRGEEMLRHATLQDVEER